MATKQRIIGHHRSLKLAERHLRALGEGWTIRERRNAKGHSNRGHTFIFEKSEEETYEWYEWIVVVTPSTGPREFTVIVTARNEDEAKSTAYDFLVSDRKARNFISKGNWHMTAARGEVSEPHEPEYRNESKK